MSTVEWFLERFKCVSLKFSINHTNLYKAPLLKEFLTGPNELGHKRLHKVLLQCQKRPDKARPLGTYFVPFTVCNTSMNPKYYISM